MTETAIDVVLYREGKSLLGKKAGGQITKLRKAFGGDCEKSLEAIRLAATKEDPAEYVAGVIRAAPGAPVDVMSILRGM